MFILSVKTMAKLEVFHENVIFKENYYRHVYKWLKKCFLIIFLIWLCVYEKTSHILKL